MDDYNTVMNDNMPVNMIETYDMTKSLINPYTVTDKDEVVKIFRELNLEISTDMSERFIYGRVACDNTFQSSFYPHVDAIILWSAESKQFKIFNKIKYNRFDETTMQPVFFVTGQFFIPQSYEELVDSIQAFKENLKYHIDKAYEKNVGNILDALE